MSRNARYDRSEKGRARRRRYDKSPKGRARSQRYRDTHLEVRVGHECAYLGVHPCTPEQRKTIQDFRAKQREEINGRLNTAVA